jgi:hypothetical protein
MKVVPNLDELEKHLEIFKIHHMFALLEQMSNCNLISKHLFFDLLCFNLELE